MRQSVPGDILSSKASPGGGGDHHGDTRTDECTGDHSSATTFKDRNRTRQMELDSRFEITEELQNCSAKSLLPVRLNKWYKHFLEEENTFGHKAWTVLTPVVYGKLHIESSLYGSMLFIKKSFTNTFIVTNPAGSSG